MKYKIGDIFLQKYNRSIWKITNTHKEDFKEGREWYTVTSQDGKRFLDNFMYEDSLDEKYIKLDNDSMAQILYAKT
jgi:hypothetical protein